MGKITKKSKESKDLKLCRKKTKINKVGSNKFYNTRSKRTRLDDLPIEVLTEIFSHLSHDDLFKNIRPVCPKFYVAATSRSLWKKIAVGPEVDSGLLQRWLEWAPHLRTLELKSRMDAGAILKKVVKHNKSLEDIRMHHCWGSKRQINLPSDLLCKLLIRCPYLHSISLTGSKFLSCKFFKLLAVCKHLHAKKKKLNKARSVHTVSFSGCASLKQLRVFLYTRKATKSSGLSYLSVECESGEFQYSRDTVEETEDDIERILGLLEFLQ